MHQSTQTWPILQRLHTSLLTFTNEFDFWKDEEKNSWHIFAFKAQPTNQNQLHIHAKQNFFNIQTKQCYALKNQVEGLSDEASCPWESPKKLTKIGQPYICHQTKGSFDSLIKCNLQVFQNHTKQAKINVVFHHFPLLGLNKPP